MSNVGILQPHDWIWQLHYSKSMVQGGKTYSSHFYLKYDLIFLKSNSDSISVLWLGKLQPQDIIKKDGYLNPCHTNNKGKQGPKSAGEEMCPYPFINIFSKFHKLFPI